MIAAIALVACSLAVSLFSSSKFSDGFSPGREVRIAERIDYGRAASWGVAYKMLSQHPVFGVGPGGFRGASPFSRPISDLRWAHNEFLQIGAELGVVGLFLVMALFAWTFMRLASPLAGSSTVAALAVGALATHASVDYLLHFPALPAVALALVGSTPLRGPRVKAVK
jgi:O-antigen ligase